MFRALATRTSASIIRTPLISSTALPTRSIPSSSIFVNPLQQQQARGLATKKAGGTVTNKPGSPGKRYGLKKSGGQAVLAGNILIRQHGRKYWEGENVG